MHAVHKGSGSKGLNIRKNILPATRDFTFQKIRELLQVILTSLGGDTGIKWNGREEVIWTREFEVLKVEEIKQRGSSYHMMKHLMTWIMETAFQ